MLTSRAKNSWEVFLSPLRADLVSARCNAVQGLFEEILDVVDKREGIRQATEDIISQYACGSIPQSDVLEQLRVMRSKIEDIAAQQGARLSYIEVC